MTSFAGGIESKQSDLPYLSLGWTLAYSVANFGYGAFYTLNNAVIALYLAGFTKNAVILILMGNTHSFEGAVIQPLVGSASDRMRSKMGRRIPFMLVSIPISALFLLLTPYCAHMPPDMRLGALVACIFLFTVTFNIAQDPYNALMPDITPEPQRGRVTGISMFVFLLGQTAIGLVPRNLTLPMVGHVILTVESKFRGCGILMLLTTLFTALTIREPGHPREVVQTTPHFQALLMAIRGLLTLKQARKALTVSLLSGLGIGAVFPVITVFVKSIAHCTDDQAIRMFITLVGVTAVCVAPFGWIVDKKGPRAVLLVALCLIAAAALGGLWVQNLDQIRVVMIIAGLGNGAQFAAAYPLLYKLVPPEEVGFYTGLQSTALSITAPVTGVITGVLVNRGGFRSIFAVCSFCVVAAIVALLAVKESKAPVEIAMREEMLRKASSLLTYPVK